MKTDLLDCLRHPLESEGERLAVAPGGYTEGGRLVHGWLASFSGSPIPVLGGVPLAVADLPRWLGAHRDAVLASLAEHGLADPEAVAIVDEAAARDVDPMAFSDDWVPGEGQPIDGPISELEGPASEAFARLWDEARQPEAVLDELLDGDGDGLGRVLEVGTGLGLAASRLASRAQDLVVGDLSLRAVLGAVERSGGQGVVLDAQALPFAPGSFDVLVAANVIDLVDDVEAFLSEAERVLAPGGRMALTTPDPGLGGPGTGDELGEELIAYGFEVLELRDGIPWLRRHSARFCQVYALAALVVRKVT